MCYIAGIIGRIDEDNRRALRHMADAMAQCGPDGVASWISPADEHGRACLLAHRRLAIFDQASGHALVFNGEIYNFVELRADLRAYGLDSRSTGDTEVLTRCLVARGPEAVRDLRGMFEPC